MCLLPSSSFSRRVGVGVPLRPIAQHRHAGRGGEGMAVVPPAFPPPPGRPPGPRCTLPPESVGLGNTPPPCHTDPATRAGVRQQVAVAVPL